MRCDNTESHFEIENLFVVLFSKDPTCNPLEIPGRKEVFMGVVVRQKKPGKGKPWWVFINHEGMRQSKCVGDKAAAEEVASQIRAQIQLGQYEFPEEQQAPPTVMDCAGRWLRTYVKNSLAKSTYQSYESALRLHILPVMGECPMDQIRRADIKDLIYRKMGEGLDPKTIRNITTCLSSLMTHAMEDEIIPANPAFRMGRHYRKKPKQRDQINPLTREELSLVLETARAHYSSHYPTLLCAARTGLRMGELLAVQWGDLDFNGGFIEVRRAWVRGELKAPKSGKSRRVDMSIQLMDTLKRLMTSRKEEALKKGWKSVPEWVFCNEEGGPLDKDNLRKRVFYKCLEKAGVRRVRFHDLRHTYASLLLQQGESPQYVQSQLGHHSIQVTVDIYGHLIPGANRHVVDRLDDDFPRTHPHPIRTQQEKKDSTESAKSLNLLVAGGGFEPPTSGL